MEVRQSIIINVTSSQKRLPQLFTKPPSTHHSGLVEPLSHFGLEGSVRVHLELLPDDEDDGVKVEPRHVSVGGEAHVAVTLSTDAEVLNEAMSSVVQRELGQGRDGVVPGPGELDTRGVVLGEGEKGCLISWCSVGVLIFGGGV